LSHFRGWHVFYDHESIPAAAQFPDVLRRYVTEADVVLVVIGPRWLSALRERAAAGAVDHVREEIRLALGASHAVLPVAVGHASIPSAEDLAGYADIVRLGDLNGVQVRPDPDLEPDIAHLLTVIGQLAPGEGPGTVLAGKYKLLPRPGQIRGGTAQADEGGRHPQGGVR
jgi:hypothetical protein